MLRSKVIKKELINNRIWKVEVKGDFKKPKLGQFFSIIIPAESEYPVSIGDYKDNILIFHIESKKIIDKIFDYIIIKGPLGRPINIVGNRVVGVSYGSWCYDLYYPLYESYRQGKDVKMFCIDCLCDDFEKVNEIKGDTILISAPYEILSKLNIKEKKVIYAYIRWAKMNCMLGVCGVCEFKGIISCIQGPYIEVEKIVDKG
jgi:hypothetical protein